MRSKTPHPVHTPLAILAASLAASTTHADIPPDYGFDWATIGDPGNRATLDEELPIATSNRHIGAVDYTYRMATTEVTIGQYFEFVEAYLPYYEANTGNVFGSSEFTGGAIRTAFGEASIREGENPDEAIRVSWEYAARYVNWLHNGKATNEAAFEQGAYDTSTFTENPDGSWNHQASHTPGASFWLPTLDEWTKAAHWDPDKNDGEGGYWLFPNGSDIQSLPMTERNAGPSSEGFPLSVGSFPDTQSPWGILDFEGGVSEWTETVVLEMNDNRNLLGSHSGDLAYGEPIHPDMLGRLGSSFVFARGGIRLASTVPAPSTGAGLLILSLGITRRKRT